LGTARSGGKRKEAARLRLRAATLDDARFLFRLRNDAATRASSFHTGELRFADHRAWLSARLGDPERRTRLFVALVVGSGERPLPVGQVRFDYDGRARRAEISIALAARFRGRGLSTPLLLHALGRAPRGADRVLARVRVENAVSQRAFVKAGFRRHGGVRARPARHVVFLWRRARRRT